LQDDANKEEGQQPGPQLLHVRKTTGAQRTERERHRVALWNFHLVQRLAERKGSSCVGAGRKERRCAYLALVFGLVHLLANIPIWRGRKGLEGIERLVLPFLYVSFVSVFYLNSFLFDLCALSPVCSHFPTPLPTTVLGHFPEFLTFTRPHLKPRDQILQDQIKGLI
jgi:hypothetical protein